MSKKPWGTITHPKERNPNFLMGYQKLSAQEVEDLVVRLNTPEWHNRHEKNAPKITRQTAVEPKTQMKGEDIESTVLRLTKEAHKHATDSNRTGSMKEQGVCNTYQWKGWT